MSTESSYDVEFARSVRLPPSLKLPPFANASADRRSFV